MNARAGNHGPHCRGCGQALSVTFLDLGATPLANALLTTEQLNEPESSYPLHAYVCDRCLLVQLEEVTAPSGIFSDYAYFSSYSRTWIAHARTYAEMISRRLGLGSGSLVAEIGSNDGYLLQNFADLGVPNYGIEPAENVAKVARDRGIQTEIAFFGVELAENLVARGKGADLIVANNVFAHVPDLEDFTAGLKLLLRPGGMVTIEVPHLLRLMQNLQFDTIYHEHFSYFSYESASRALEKKALRVVDVDELPTHGGSLRLYVAHADDADMPVSVKVEEIRERERSAGLHDLDGYLSFSERVASVKLGLLEFLTRAKMQGKKIAGFGAAAKGNTLLNYCGIRKDLVDFVVDNNPYKQGRHLPGSRIPIHAPEHLQREHPDYVLLLPWNLRDEIMEEAAYIRDWGGRFVVPIPTLEVIE